MTASDGLTKKSSLALRTIHTDGTSDPILRVLEISAGRDTGVPQMVAIEAGLMLAWTDTSPAYGVKTTFLRWEDLQNSRSIKSAFLSDAASFGYHNLPFTQSICRQTH